MEEEEDIEVVKSQFRPYQDEPLKEDEKGSSEEADVGWPFAQSIGVRYERTVAVNSWIV